MTEVNNNAEWYISGCLRCSYSEHSPRPSERCPNDGSALVRFPGIIPAWRMVEVCRAMSQAFTTERQAKYARQAMKSVIARNEDLVIVDA
jgi:hypothetical protein